MLGDLKQQWKERSIRKLAYMTQGKLHFQPINFAEYEKSCTRTEMPNKFKKVGSPKVVAEEVFDWSQYEQSKSTRTSPKSSKSYSMAMMNKSSKKPFYYVKNNEIMSIDQFFELYQSAVGQQKLKEKFDNKYKLEEKKKKIEDIHKRNQRLMKHAVSANNSLIIQPDKLDLKTDYSVQVQSPVAHRMESSQQISEETPYIDPRPVRQIKFSPRIEEKTFSPNERVSVNGSIIRHRTGSLDEGCQRGMTADQKFTEREIYKHLVRMTVSPKPVRITSGKNGSKERVYASMFKDPKMMDCMVEHSIKRAQYLIVKKNQGAIAQSYRLTTNKSDGVNYRVDSISEIDSKDHQEREGEFVGQELSMMNLKEDSKKNSMEIAKKIKVNIKHIDNLLRTKSPKDKEDLKSPKLLNRTVILDVKSKNKFPLRSTIAQRYNFGEKLQDQRKIAGQIKKVSKSYRKDAVDSAIKSQTYVSYYN